MRHSSSTIRPCRRYTAAVATFLFFLAARAECQVGVNLGGTVQQVWIKQARSYFVKGFSTELWVKTSAKGNLIARLRLTGRPEQGDEDLVKLTSIELGWQHVFARDKPILVASGFGLGIASLEHHSDAIDTGVSLFAQTRVSWFPLPQAGFFVEGEGRLFDGRPMQAGLSLNLGISIGLNH